MFVGAALFTLAWAYAAGHLLLPSLRLLRVIRLGVGTACVSLFVFVLLLLGWAAMPVFLGAGAFTIIAAAWRWKGIPHDSTIPIHPALWLPFAAYAAMYALQAMAPEIQPDALTYHLGLTAEYARLHHFPDRIGFYEVIPQGLEMVFTVAYALGGGAAAKLFHFGLFLATLPLMLSVGQRLRITPVRSFAAALLYFAMPVAGITGTSTYNDAALVFFALGTFWCLLAWHADRQTSLLLVAGLLTGFCFSIKITGLPIMAATVLAIAFLARRILPIFAIAAAASIPSAPWVVRAFALTGNPFAPLLNHWFPNPFFNAAAEQTMAANLRSYPGFTLASAPWEYALHGGLQGIVGPLFFALPIALLALRTRPGRILLLAAVVALCPWFFNAGTRFLMPAIPFFACALAATIPVLPISIVVAIQLILCWPPILQRFEAPHAWAFHEIPWQAAFRLEPEPAYLSRVIGEYDIARMIEQQVPTGGRVFCLTPAAKAYTTRDVVRFWYSTPDESLGEALQTALATPARVALSATIAPQPVTGVRLVAARDGASEFRIFELTFSRPVTTEWQLQASPNVSEAVHATDGNVVTSWRSRAAVEHGMFLAVLFGKPINIERVQAEVPDGTVSLLVQTQQVNNGLWRTAADDLRTTRLPRSDLRRDATHALGRAGFRYILASAGTTGMDLVSDDMVKHTAEWGLKHLGEFTPVHLFEIAP